MTLFKSVKPDGRTRNGLDWNVPPGTVIRADHDLDSDNTGVCPGREGDGISIAKTWHGAALAGWPTDRCCIITVDPAHILAEDSDKLRASRVTVGEWFSALELLRQGFGASADLQDASLYGADLHGADLYSANLHGADLRGADLYGADLRGADLHGADLRGADLYGADLYGADLYGADLYGTDLYGAGLYGWERGPDGFARRVSDA